MVYATHYLSKSPRFNNFKLDYSVVFDIISVTCSDFLFVCLYIFIWNVKRFKVIQILEKQKMLILFMPIPDCLFHL